MTGLSPAQKALSAFNKRYELCGPFDDDWVEQCLAAAIEALVVHAGRGLYRNELRAIAAELRGVRCSMTRALSGDKETARQFLHEAGFIDKEGKLRPPYCSEKL